MRRLDLDFHARPSRRTGWVLLAVAVAFFLHVSFTYRDMQERIAEAESASAPSTRPARVRPPVVPIHLESSYGFASGVVRQLTLPWDRLFGAVEEATSKQVALLTIQPEAQKGVLNVTGEAKDYAAILTFITRLEETKVLRNVHLVNHEVRDQDPDRPLHFTVAGFWMGVK